ncbi:hypothetical protein AAVH_13914 [Aphelenchoides avenae]|nr:hypothetical protein AAVH_13914 [Aphelenchus avenae]
MWLDRCIYEYKVVPLMTGALDISYYYAMTYAMFFQFFTNVAIACNRFTAISFPAQHAKIWRGKSLFFIVSLVLFLPFLCASSRPVIALAAGGAWWASWGWAEHYRIVVTVAVLVLVCLSNGSMELWTFYVYHKMNAARRRQNREEYRLLLYAMLELIMILLRTFYFFLLATTDGSNWRLIGVAVDYMRYVVSVETFSSPVFLFSTSTVVRQGYLRFYRCTSKNSESQTVLFSRTISAAAKS